MISVIPSQIKFSQVDYNFIHIKGRNDLGASCDILFKMNNILANSIRITLKMLYPNGEQILPKSDSAMFNGPSITASYNDSFSTELQSDGLHMFKVESDLRLISAINSVQFKNETPDMMREWYNSKSLLMVNIPESMLRNVQDKLEKIFPFGQDSPENVHSYKYITS